MLTRNAIAFLTLASLTACVAQDEAAAGQETAACVEGSCFGDLECLSDICVSPEDAEDGTGTSGGSASASSTSGSSSPSGTSGASGASSASGTNPTSPATTASTSGATTDDTDSGYDPTVGTGPSTCTEVDVLFVVDHSASMSNEHARLLEAAPGFIDELVGMTGSTDPHVMVVDVDAWVLQSCETICGLLPECADIPGYVCGESTPLECEDVIGAGVSHPRGTDAVNADCGFTSGGRYIDGSQPDFNSALECALSVGTLGGTGRTMEAMVGAIDAMGEAADCNSGFLRDDAALVVVFVTDEEDGAEDSLGEPPGWHIRMVGAKGGATEQIFVMGIFGDIGHPNQQCSSIEADPDNGSEPSPRLSEFTDLWGERGLRRSVCADNYRPHFDDFLSTIEAACE